MDFWFSYKTKIESVSIVPYFWSECNCVNYQCKKFYHMQACNCPPNILCLHYFAFLSLYLEENMLNSCQFELCLLVAVFELLKKYIIKT